MIRFSDVLDEKGRGLRRSLKAELDFHQFPLIDLASDLLENEGNMSFCIEVGLIRNSI